MKVTPNKIIIDLEEYLELFNIKLSENTRKTLLDAEEFAYRCGNPTTYKLFFSKLIRNTDIVHTIFDSKGINPNLVAIILEKDYYNCMDEDATFENDNILYSGIYNRINCEKRAVIDTALEYCVKKNRYIITNEDIFLAAMDVFERLQAQDCGQWAAKELNETHSTLSHVYGLFDPNLWISFDDIRQLLCNPKSANKHTRAA